jgi:glycosyltransferase involved in cell wall biosynthesis
MRLSIALCTYNGDRFLDDQLASYASQKRLPDEVVVCDDGSTDRTLSVVRHFARSVPFDVRIYNNQTRLGYRRNFEKAVSLCKGDIILFSDQDDVWYSTKLKKVEETFSKVPHAGALFSNADLVDENLRLLGQTVWQKHRFSNKLQDMVIRGRGPDVVVKASSWAWLGMTIAFRSEFRKWLLPFGCYKMGHDSWTMTLLAFISDITLIREPLGQYRQHSDNFSGGVQVDPLGDRLISTVLNKPRGARQKRYLTRMQVYKAVRNRLMKVDRVHDMERKILMLEKKIGHLNTRANMPLSRIERVPYILRECFNSGYHHYSEGFLDVLRDLLEKDRG